MWKDSTCCKGWSCNKRIFKGDKAKLWFASLMLLHQVKPNLSKCEWQKSFLASNPCQISVPAMSISCAHFAEKTILVVTDAAVMTKISLRRLCSLANVHFLNGIRCSKCKSSPILELRRLLTLHLQEILYARGFALMERLFWTIVICPKDKSQSALGKVTNLTQH